MSKRGIVRACGVLIVFLAVTGMSFLLSRASLEGLGVIAGSHRKITITEREFTESNRELNNPYRGFYSLYGFTITDEKQSFYQETAKKMHNDRFALALIEINLLNYKEGPITEQGMENIKELFAALRVWNKQYLIRFLYDWNGSASETEPDDIRVILGHMEQLEDVFYEHRDMIFVCQGVFVGNCGEMNNSRHMTDAGMLRLMEQLSSVTPNEVFLSVRTPSYWRIITGISEPEEFGSSKLSKRLGLFNDGIMGTELDTGTYGTASKEKVGRFCKWNREEELAFQSELCKYVPNGGEVIVENPINDFPNAVHNLGLMHITYINRDYDADVFAKWKESVVTEEGVFYGMDGLTYVDRHLGYRLYITEVALDCELQRERLSVEIALRNVGFAPMYREPDKMLLLLEKGSGVMRIYPVDAKLRSLAGGNESEKQLELSAKIALKGLEAGEYEIFFMLKDRTTACVIELSNEQELTEFGYLIGEVTIEEQDNAAMSQGT